MKTVSNSYEPKYAAEDVPKLKTVRLRVGASDPNLESTIRKVFFLAKSAGRELDLIFGSGDPRPNPRNPFYLQ